MPSTDAFPKFKLMPRMHQQGTGAHLQEHVVREPCEAGVAVARQVLQAHLLPMAGLVHLVQHARAAVGQQVAVLRDDLRGAPATALIPLLL